MAAGKPVTLSIVVPVYSGRDYLSELATRVKALKTTWAKAGAPFELSELIFVNDAAIDDSAVVLDRLDQELDWVTVATFSRNFGQHPATAAGILMTKSDWVVTIDEDLQHPPESIEGMLKKVCETNADVVYGKPLEKVHGGFLRDLASRTYKSLMEWLTGNANLRDVNSFRLIRGPIAREAARVSGHDTYFDIALSWFTTRIATLPLVLRDERHIEEKASGYNLRKLLSHARRLAMSSQLRVLRLGAFVGFALFGLSVVGTIALLILWLFFNSVIAAPGWTSLFLLTSVLGGITLMLLGILLEYSSSMIMHSHGRPNFFIVDRSSDIWLREYFLAADPAPEAAPPVKELKA